MLSACGSSGTGDLTIESGKAKDLIAKTSSVFGCKRPYAPSGSRNGRTLFCTIPGGPDGTQLHFDVWSPDFESTQGLQELINQCQDVTSAEVTQRGNFVIVGKNWGITMGGTISPKQVNGMRKLAKVNVYDCSG